MIDAAAEVIDKINHLTLSPVESEAELIKAECRRVVDTVSPIYKPCLHSSVCYNHLFCL